MNLLTSKGYLRKPNLNLWPLKWSFSVLPTTSLSYRYQLYSCVYPIALNWYLPLHIGQTPGLNLITACNVGVLVAYTGQNSIVWILEDTGTYTGKWLVKISILMVLQRTLIIKVISSRYSKILTKDSANKLKDVMILQGQRFQEYLGQSEGTLGMLNIIKGKKCRAHCITKLLWLRESYL